MINEVSLGVEAKVHSRLEAFILKVIDISTRNPSARAFVARDSETASATEAAAIRARDLETKDWNALLLLQCDAPTRAVGARTRR